MASGTVYSLIRANTQFSNAKMTINPKLLLFLWLFKRLLLFWQLINNFLNSSLKKQASRDQESRRKYHGNQLITKEWFVIWKSLSQLLALESFENGWMKSH